MKMPVNGKLGNAIRFAFFSLAFASLPAGAIAQEAGEATQALKADPLTLEEGADAATASLLEPEVVSRNEQNEELPRGRKEPAGEPAEPTRPPTEITASKETSFDEKTRRVVFVGDVIVKDPEFHLTCERLTVFLKKGGGSASGASSANEEPSSPGEGGLERVIAEGKVVIIQAKPDDKGKITRYVGKAAKAEYNGITGDVTLSGWPQIQQGINNQIATEEGTVMILNRNGRMQTRGASKTVIAESSEAPKRNGSGKRSVSSGSPSLR